MQKASAESLAFLCAIDPFYTDRAFGYVGGATVTCNKSWCKTT